MISPMSNSEALKEKTGPMKDRKNDHYWIDDGILYESYWTIRGLRYRALKEVPGMSDNDRCDDACINYISKQYYQQ